MVFKFDRRQYELAKEYIPKCCEEKTKPIYDDNNFIVTVSDEDLDDFQMSADEAIIAYGMVDEDYLDDLGCELQLLYDEIYYQICRERE